MLQHVRRKTSSSSTRGDRDPQCRNEQRDQPGYHRENEAIETRLEVQTCPQRNNSAKEVDADPSAKHVVHNTSAEREGCGCVQESSAKDNRKRQPLHACGQKIESGNGHQKCSKNIQFERLFVI